jgi:RNase H-fold protein (predicted Holliday junction resolvase)
MPSKQEDIQQKIRKFIESLKLVIDSTIVIETMDEDYTSVQS